MSLSLTLVNINSKCACEDDPAPAPPPPLQMAEPRRAPNNSLLGSWLAASRPADEQPVPAARNPSGRPVPALLAATAAGQQTGGSGGSGGIAGVRPPLAGLIPQVERHREHAAQVRHTCAAAPVRGLRVFLLTFLSAPTSALFFAISC